MRISLLACLFAFSITSFSQTYWEVFEDSNFYSTSVEELETDNAGNIYAWGTQPVELYPTENFIDKKDPDGNLIWKTDIEGYVMTYVVSPEGISYVLMFTSEETAYYDANTFFVRAYDTNGEELWQKNISAPDRLYNEMNEESMALDADGNIVTAMQSFNIPEGFFTIIDETFRILKLDGENGNVLRQTSITVEDDHQTPLLFMRTDSKSSVYLFIDIHGVPENALYKFDKWLNMKWQKDYGNYEPQAMITDRNKAVYLIDGVFSGSAWDYVETLKLNAVNGDTIFNSQILTPEFLGTSSSLNVYSVTLDKKNNLVLVYEHNWSGSSLDPNIIQKIRSTNGTLLFASEILSTEADYFFFNSISVNLLNEIFIGGFVSTSNKPSIMKYSKAGTKIWEHTVVTDKEKDISDYVFTPLNNYVMGGREEVLITTARYTVSFDCSLAERLPSPATFTETDNAFLIYPNPATYTIQLSTGITEHIEYIHTYNTAGVSVPVSFNEFLQADVSHLPAGIYLTEIITAKEKVTEKWVKE